MAGASTTDIWDDALARLRAGPQNTPTGVQPAEADDPFAASEARLKSEFLADKLARTRALNPLFKTGKYAEPHAGEVAEVPNYSTGESLINGLLQGFYPQAFGAVKALSTPAHTPEELEAAHEAYRKGVEEKIAGRKAFHEQNPGMALTTELGGSAATAIPMMAAGQEYLAAPMGNLLRSAAPKIGSGIADFLAGSIKGVGSIPSLATRGAIEGTAGAGIGSELSDKPLAEQMATGALLGGSLNPLLGTAGRALASKISPTSARNAQSLLDQGIPVQAGQIPGASPITSGLQKVFSRGAGKEQNEAFSEALTGHAGASSKVVDQKWVKANDERMGKVMNDIQSVYSIPQLENGLLTDLSSIRQHAIDNMSVDNAKKVGGFIDKIEENTLNPINGKIYQNLTQKGGILDNISRDKDIETIAPKLRDALDEAWGRALPADKKAAWDQARKEYKITRTIDDSMGASGAAEGEYNPKKLLAAVERRYGNVENAGDLGQLAAGGQFLKSPGEGVLSHGSPYKLPLQVATGVAGGAAVSEGVKAASHYAPEFLAQIAHSPAEYVGPLAAAGVAYGGGSFANWLLNRPAATKHLLDVTLGKKSPVLRGVNPVLPFLVQGANRQ